jgi:hypothetical protein
LLKIFASLIFVGFLAGTTFKEAPLDNHLDFHGLITRKLMFIKKGDASPFRYFKSCNLKYAKYE